MRCVTATMEEAATQWCDFSSRCSGHIFSTYEWVSAWADAFCKDKDDIKVFILKKGNKIAAIMPLWLNMFKIRFAGHRFNDINGPLWNKELTDYSEAMTAILKETRFRFYQLRHVYSDGISDRLPHGRDTAYIPTLYCENDFDEYYNKKSKKLRSNIRNAERRIEKEFGAFSLEHSFEDIEGRIDSFASIHAYKKQRGMKDMFEDRRFVAFVKNLSRRMEDKGYMKSLILRINGETAAYKLSFVFNGNMYFWNTAFHPSYSRYRCGELMYREEIRFAYEKGLKAVFMGRGAGYNKTVWTDKKLI